MALASLARADRAYASRKSWNADSASALRLLRASATARQKLAAECHKVVATPEVKEKLLALGLELIKRGETSKHLTDLGGALDRGHPRF
jgi:phosphosulfolactate phosphohydrolase-like enzyme